jgi:gamma-glutamylcyclotransferase (GGCT)/AIG2-like uncharacterized protein YtfP
LRLFLYGTLQPAADTPMARWLGLRIREDYAATLPGRLVAIASRNGWFPALVRGSPGERCRGTLVCVALGPGDLARLDRYEGREYRRVVVRPQVSGGQRSAASVYLWRRAAPLGAEAICGGDFLAWLERTGRPAFATRRNGREAD